MIIYCLRIFLLIFIILILTLTCAIYCATFILFVPLYYLVPSLHAIYDSIAVRWMNSVLNALFMSQNCKVYEYGEDITSILNDNCLVLINHQTTADVPLIAHVFNAKRLLMHKITWVQDAAFRWLPFGWVSLLRKDIFILQGKDTRSQQLQELIAQLKFNFTKLQRKWIIIFPEGGFLYKRITSSKAFALKNGYPDLDYVTLPRIGAVDVVLNTLSQVDSTREAEISLSNEGTMSTTNQIQNMNKIKYIVDVTIAYANFYSPPSFFDIIMRVAGASRIYLYYRIYDINKVPRKSTYELQTWLFKVYTEKNNRLAKYYTSGEFQHLGSDLSEIPSDRLMPFPKPLLVDWDSLIFSLFNVVLWGFFFFYYLPAFLVKSVIKAHVRYHFLG